VPTATPEPPDAPLYPNSPIQAWNRDAFLQASRNAVQGFYDYFGPVVTDVPGDWYPRYYRYRTILNDVRAAAAPITGVCTGRGGTVSPESDQAILASLLTAIGQLDQLLAESLARHPASRVVSN
jgi:hypothetical protein